MHAEVSIQRIHVKRPAYVCACRVATARMPRTYHQMSCGGNGCAAHGNQRSRWTGIHFFAARGHREFGCSFTSFAAQAKSKGINVIVLGPSINSTNADLLAVADLFMEWPAFARFHGVCHHLMINYAWH